MSLRSLFLATFTVLALGAAGALWAFNTYAVTSVAIGPVAEFIITAATFVGICVLVIIGILFTFLIRVIARPLHELQRAIAAFAKDGTRTPFTASSFSPTEIRSLESGFIDLTTAVDASRERDKDISLMKSDFISTAAHQIRTPLTGIRWALEALQQSALTPEQQPLVQNATDKSHELVAIMKTLLDTSSVESGKYTYVFRPLDLAAMAADVTRDMEPMAKERQVSLTFLAGDPVPPVRADAERVKWIVNNLVENALRYTPAGGTVRLTLNQDSGRVSLHVADSGIGIRKEDKPNIFERFYRGENARAKENAGNGLGLYIARNIAKDHGGTLEFADNPGGSGTIFTLTLPVAA